MRLIPRPSLRLPVRICLVLAGAAIACQSLAGPAGSPFSSEKAVAPASLDGYRGGFTTDTGLAVTLGIERIVTINGDVAGRSQLDFGDLGRLTSGQATLSADTARQLGLIQNGTADLNVQLGPGVLGGTFIQNSLNNQLINNATIINASVEARGMLQNMNFQSTLSNALNTAVTGR
jgi:hypothetical protein